MAQLYVKMLGDPSVSVDGRKVTFAYRKADALLYYLILRKRATRNELAGLLWADSDTASALKNLRHAVYTIRKGLGLDVFSQGQWTMLELNPQVVIQCDVYQFLEEGDLSVYQGEFLSGFSIPNSSLFEDWLTEQRNLLQTKYLKSLLYAEKEAFQKRDLVLAERLGLKYVQMDPLEERAAVILMELYSEQKKFRKAIGIYHELCKNLSAELGISPLKETTALYYHIVNEWNSSTYKIEDQPYHLLVAKDAVLRSLLSMCNGPAGEHHLPCALVEGEAGVGKTYLLDHLLNYYDFSDWLVCRSFCYQSESNVALSAWNSIMMTLMSELEGRQFSVPENYLKTAAGLFPCLSASFGQEYAACDWSYPLQQNYHAAQESAMLIFAAVAKRFPILLVFEDIHWMDKSSAELLAVFLRRMRNLNITVICTSRDIYPAHVKTFLDSALRDHIMERYTISRFNREETERFVHHYCSQDPTPEQMSQIYESTGGNALLLVQLMSSLQEQPDLTDFSKNLGNIIGHRLSHLTLEERQVLDLISVFPDWAAFDSLSAILTKDTLELMYLCGQLKQRLLVQEVNREGGLYYALAHERIRSALMEKQSQAARRILHLRVAQYLESQMELGPERPYERLIYHYSEGGNRFKVFQYRVLSLNAYAGMYYAVFPMLAGDSDTRDQNMEDYFRYLEGELAELRSGTSDWSQLDQLEMTLLHAKSCYCVYVGQYPAGLEALGRLIRLCGAAGNTALLVRAHLQLVYYGIQIWDIPVMEEHLKAGMELLADNVRSEEYGIYLRLSGLLQMMKGDYELSRSICYQSIDTFRLIAPGNDERYAINIAGAYNYIAESYRLEGNYDQAFLSYDQAIIYNRSRGYYPGAAVFYTNYGVAAFQKGEKEIARQLFLFALETYRAAHEYSGRPIALSYLAFYEAEEGRFALAADYIREAMQVSEMIGSPWWEGVTLYQCWKIRVLLEERGQESPELSALWPESPKEHCQLCLSYLRQLQPRLETQEMEAALAELETKMDRKSG